MATEFLEQDVSCCSLWNGNRRFLQRSRQSEHEDGAAQSIADELNMLSLKERTAITEEQHGVADIIVETSDFVQDKLQAFRQYILEKVPQRQKKAWDRAVFLRPSLQTDDSFHLMFLRSKRFDTKEAAVSCCVYFENKLELFGEDLLVKRITLDCLDDGAIEVLKAGGLMYLPGGDSRGRGVQLWNIYACNTRDAGAFTRAIWYQIMTETLENEQLQRHGVVLIAPIYEEHARGITTCLRSLWPKTHITQAWPHYVNCTHVLHDYPLMDAFKKTLALAQPKELRIRQLYHFASIQEAQYRLLTFGINLEGWLVPGVANLSRDSRDAYIQFRRRKDAEWRSREDRFELPTSHFAIYPNAQDVLMGRGKFRDWSGNLRLSKIIASYAQRYIEADSKDRIEKTIISIEIIQRIVTEFGTRFLQRTDTGWEMVSQEVARDKVSHALRTEAKRVLKGKGQRR